jgi:hypothetical protein
MVLNTPYLPDNKNNIQAPEVLLSCSMRSFSAACKTPFLITDSCVPYPGFSGGSGDGIDVE